MTAAMSQNKTIWLMVDLPRRFLGLRFFQVRVSKISTRVRGFVHHLT
jgi:hypothetical protein